MPKVTLVQTNFTAGEITPKNRLLLGSPLGALSMAES